MLTCVRTTTVLLPTGEWKLDFQGEVGREQSDNVGWAEYYQTSSHHFRDDPGGREVVTVLVEDPGCVKYTGPGMTRESMEKKSQTVK